MVAFGAMERLVHQIDETCAAYYEQRWQLAADAPLGQVLYTINRRFVPGTDKIFMITLCVCVCVIITTRATNSIPITLQQDDALQ